MIVEISAFWAIILVVLVYTIIQYLANWTFRLLWKLDEPVLFVWVILNGLITFGAGSIIYSIIENMR